MSKKNSYNVAQKRSSNKSEKFGVDNRPQTQEVIKENEKKSFFQRWFRWDVITGIATILMLAIAIWALLPPDPLKTIKENIRNNVKIVETTFNPQTIASEKDSSGYNQLLVSLQQSTLDYCTLWEAYEKAEPYSKYAEISRDELASLLKQEFSKQRELNNAAKGIIRNIRDLTKLEIKLNSISTTPISMAKQVDILHYVDLKDSVINASFQNCMKYLNKANDGSSKTDSEVTENIRKGLNELDKMKNDVNYYKMDDAILDYAIECNKLYMISRRQFVDESVVIETKDSLKNL